ncbi:hypothetical protein [Halobacillus hunanensis]|nr:hypothetical protein [Halobacillus hunanensis]
MEQIFLLITACINLTVAVINLTVLLVSKRKKKKNLNRHQR